MWIYTWCELGPYPQGPLISHGYSEVFPYSSEISGWAGTELEITAPEPSVETMSHSRGITSGPAWNLDAAVQAGRLELMKVTNGLDCIIETRRLEFCPGP